jgi:phosphoribosylformimino-5-aminoimidazole carboxamide ribotide isomerase
MVDLDGARDGHRVNDPVIRALAAACALKLQVGGGIRTGAALEALLEAGVSRVVIGSAAVQRPQEVLQWLKRYGPHRVCLAFDVRAEPTGKWYVHTHGWTQGGRITLWDALAPYRTHVRHVLSTDIARDGTLTGPNLELYAAAVAAFPHIHWQASGGVRDAADLAALARLGVSATVSGKALLEGRIPHEELQPFLPDASSPASTYATARS